MGIFSFLHKSDDEPSRSEQVAQQAEGYLKHGDLPIIKSIPVVRSFFKPPSHEDVQALTAKTVKQYIGNDDSVSAELMRRCIDGDTHEPLTFDDISNADEYRNELADILQYAADDMAIGETRVVHVASRHVEHNADTTEVTMGEVHDFDQKGYKRTAKDISEDLARALGSVTITKTADGIVVEDYFDFELPDENVADKPRDLAIAALESFNNGYQDTANTYVGRMFCKEGESERHTDSSVPVRFEISNATLDSVAQSRNLAPAYVNSEAPYRE